MNFFQQQHQAHRRTRLLVGLFLLAVVVIVLAVNGTLALLWQASHGGMWSAAAQAEPYPKFFFLTNTVLTVGLIGAGTLIELFNLRDGGDAVAQMVGGQLVSRTTGDAQERRLLNVVDEMALAARLACPRVYLLPNEEAINAFAAGYNPHDAVVAVTQGALERLTRDELQGVIAHEFSHILNGDMRLNIRLIGILFGIEMMAGFGRTLMQWGSIGRPRIGSASDRDQKGVSLQLLLFVFGLALFVIGYIGIFFGRLIKAAVSREREFLADASAVQFTRNADGIGGALQKIGGLSRQGELGSEIAHSNAEHLSHLFLGAAKPSLVDGLFATHPPIAERLQRIFGRSVAVVDAPLLTPMANSIPMLPDLPYASARASLFDVAAPALPLFSVSLDAALHDPHAARALMYALVLDAAQPQAAQRALLDGDRSIQTALVCEFAQQVSALPRDQHLPLLDLAAPALTQLPVAERATFLSMIDRLIAADHRITLREFVLQTLLVRRLDVGAGRSVAVRYATLAALRSECVLVLSLVARVSSAAFVDAVDAATAVTAAFGRGAAMCGDLSIQQTELVPAAALNFNEIRAALGRIAQLAPLGKPALIKVLVAAAQSPVEAEILSTDSTDIVRAICSAIDAPLPPAVGAQDGSNQKNSAPQFG